MGVDGGGDPNVGMAEEFLDHDEFDALFQEQGQRDAIDTLGTALDGPADHEPIRVGPLCGATVR
ncbi:hypothetical protein GCM10018771_15840 [Streptomyces cellulosae]|nr:hypothetical protein GCM10018771_15840 [Streptomyces cellulosae]